MNKKFIFILIILFILLFLGCSVSNAVSVNPSTSQQQQEAIQSADIFIGTEKAPVNLIFSVLGKTQLNLISEALSQAEKEGGLHSMREWDYTMNLNYEKWYKTIYMWTIRDRNVVEFIYDNEPGILFKMKTGDSRMLFSMLEKNEPVSVFRNDSEIALNQVTNPDKQKVINDIFKAAKWKQGGEDDLRILVDDSYSVFIKGIKYKLLVADGVITVIYDGRYFTISVQESAILREALGINI